jgi:7-cyano-7-deazaguanine synthase
MRESIAVLSAGLDSSVALALALEQGWTVKLALTFDYGQRAAEREVTQSGLIAAHLHIPHRVLHLPWIKEFGHAGSLVRRRDPLPYPEPADLSNPTYGKESAKAVWVPNRNGTFLEIAAGFAEDLGADALIVGFNREEAETFPDNSLGYLKALNGALGFSTSNHVEVTSLTVQMDKTAIVGEAKRMGFPLPLIWSCYEGGRRMCRKCESCRRLERALAANALEPHAFF